jgi:hypothetical protein
MTHGCRVSAKNVNSLRPNGQAASAVLAPKFKSGIPEEQIENSTDRFAQSDRRTG